VFAETHAARRIGTLRSRRAALLSVFCHAPRVDGGRVSGVCVRPSA
jgi:hypothetical protein